MLCTFGRTFLVVWFALGAAGLRHAGALETEGLQLSGNIESQTLIRHPNFDTFQLVQNRNAARLRADWRWLRDGHVLGLAPAPFLKEWNAVVLYRGVYDSFYDIAPGDRQRGQVRSDDLVGGRISDLSRSRRDDLKFENELREAYFDMRLRDLPLSLRLGRQQVIWGEADYFRLMDVWNPLDVRWHMQQEVSWDEIRVPLWLAKAVWEFGVLGPLRHAYAEFVYNPGDYRPGIVGDFLPRPWALPFPDPLRAGQVQFDPVTRFALTPRFDLQGTSVQRGRFHRTARDASEFGARFSATAPGGVEFTANYLYGRGRSVGASVPFALRIQSVDLPAVPGLGAVPVGRYQIDARDSESTVPVYPINIVAELVHPYVHIFGLTAKYFDARWTQTSVRVESAYVIGVPFQTIETGKRVPVTLQGRVVPPGFLFDLGRAPLGFTKHDQWSGMLGFDRATFVPALNRESAWFLSGQVFWTYTLGRHVDLLRGNAGTAEAPYFGPVGRWVDGPYAERFERQQNARIPGNGDDIKRWEVLLTMAATSFYRHGRLIPTLATVVDPVNENVQFLWSADYSLTNAVIVGLQQRYFAAWRAGPSNDPWFAGGRNHRRDETAVRLTYQF